jgi:hypothetical protein
MLMICHRFRTVFVHIPKTGGQSIEHVFLKATGLSWKDRAQLLMRRNEDPAYGPRTLAHLFASEYLSCGHMAPIDFEEYFKFSVVRNPWDRLASLYKYRYADKMSFRQFVLKNVPDQGSEGVRQRAIAPQCKYLFNAEGEVLVNYVARFERLGEEFRTISERVFGQIIELPRVNISASSANYKDLYDNETHDLVSQRYKTDIDRLGYKFDGFDEGFLLPGATSRSGSFVNSL